MSPKLEKHTGMRADAAGELKKQRNQSERVAAHKKLTLGDLEMIIAYTYLVLAACRYMGKRQSRTCCSWQLSRANTERNGYLRPIRRYNCVESADEQKVSAH